MSTVIKVQDLSKQYRLGKIGTGTLSHDLNRWWHRLRGKEDPYLKIGQINDRTDKTGTDDYVWALKDINFEIQQGDVVGIIGRNGAGKSTLLKILSRTTLPTLGSVKVKGRIASLLEVGTGFHPELSGRENVFLNGAILGMRKAEIRNKFDEIIDFAGVGKYIDTPVKRYSSGMYVRLAFAVAAHLEPEILIVDEVLAVGDVEFQKKCLGKMKDVSEKEGRTVLFVSHNMAAINSLCSRSILLKNGNLAIDDTTEKVISYYMRSHADQRIKGKIQYDNIESKPFQVLSASLQNSSGTTIDSSVEVNETIILSVLYKFNVNIPKTNLVINVSNENGEIVYFIDRSDFTSDIFNAQPGIYEATLRIPNPLLKPGFYNVSIGLSDMQGSDNDHKHNALSFEIKNVTSIRSGVRPGQLYLPVEWPMKKVSQE